MIAQDINDHNIYGLYAQAYTLQCEKLMKDLTKFIIDKFLNKATCVHFLTFSAKFEN